MSGPNGLERALAKRLAQKIDRLGPPEEEIAQAFADYAEMLKRDWAAGEKARKRV